MDKTQQLLIDFSKGSRNAFDEVYKRYAPMLYGLCMRYARCKDDANDMLQESFIKIHANMTNYQPQQSIEPWLKVVTRNTALDYIKKTYKYELKENDVYFDEKETLTDDENESQNKMDQILACLQQLPDGYRMVFNLFYIDNLTHKEIGTFLNISENTSKTQLMNAKKYMQKLLNEQKEMSYGNG